MRRVLIGVAMGIVLGTACTCAMGRSRGPDSDILFMLCSVPLATLGAVIGGFSAVLSELRAVRRHQALNMDDEDHDNREPPTSIKPTN